MDAGRLSVTPRLALRFDWPVHPEFQLAARDWAAFNRVLRLREQARQFLAGIFGAHEGFAHQKGVHIGRAHALDVARAHDA